MFYNFTVTLNILIEINNDMNYKYNHLKIKPFYKKCKQIFKIYEYV